MISERRLSLTQTLPDLATTEALLYAEQTAKNMEPALAGQFKRPQLMEDESNE